jgi:hypothetical protein
VFEALLIGASYDIFIVILNFKDTLRINFSKNL